MTFSLLKALMMAICETSAMSWSSSYCLAAFARLRPIEGSEQIARAYVEIAGWTPT
jgi:hypothetical protein